MILSRRMLAHRAALTLAPSPLAADAARSVEDARVEPAPPLAATSAPPRDPRPALREPQRHDRHHRR